MQDATNKYLKLRFFMVKDFEMLIGGCFIEELKLTLWMAKYLKERKVLEGRSYLQIGDNENMWEFVLFNIHLEIGSLGLYTYKYVY